MKKLGVYTFSFGIILSFFLFLKKLGISLSIAKSAMVLFVTTTITTTSLSTGIYYSVKYIKKRQDAIKKEKLILEDKKIPEIEEKHPKKKTVKHIIYSLALKPFTSVNVDSQIIKNITKTIFQELSKTKGKDKILNLRGKKQKNYKRLLTGRVEKSEESYTISVKIVDTKTKGIIYMTSGSAQSLGEINKLSTQIAGKVSKWVH